MSETYINRARVILARVKNDSSPLESKIGVTEGSRYVDAVVKVYAKNLLIDANGDPILIGNVPNEDKAKAYVNHLRQHHKEFYAASIVPAAVNTERDSQLTTANATADSDLGTPE